MKESVIDEKNEIQEDEETIIVPIFNKDQDSELTKSKIDFEQLLNNLKDYEEEIKTEYENSITNELMEKFAIINYDTIKLYDSKIQSKFENIIKSKSVNQINEFSSKTNNSSPFGKSLVCFKSSSNLINSKTNELNLKFNILKEDHEKETNTAIKQCENLIKQFENCYVVHS